jgi:hypothetical protein
VTTAPSQIYVEIGLAIENKGNRTSNVVAFSLDAAEMHFELTPAYPKSVQGRRSVWGLSGTGLGTNGQITIEPEKMVSGNLGFYVPLVPTGVFGDRLSSLDPFDGTLTVTDTEGVSASYDFHFTER